MSGIIETWVSASSSRMRELRQAVHIALDAISSTPELNDFMTMKGGILLALRYESDRFTKDIDFSTMSHFSRFDLNHFLELFQERLLIAQENLPYDMACSVQSHAVKPSIQGNYQTLEIRIGYARKETQKYRRLLKRECPDVLRIDLSFNEPMSHQERLTLDVDREISIYTKVDLIAEKLRALLQQTQRNRKRKQDPLDLYRLLTKASSTDEEKAEVLDSLKTKCEARGFSPQLSGLRAPDIRKRAASDYDTLADDIEGPLPPFDEAFGFVQDYYESLPWK